MKLTKKELAKVAKIASNKGDVEITVEDLENNPIALEKMVAFKKNFKTLTIKHKEMFQRLKKDFKKEDFRQVLEQELGRRLSDEDFESWLEMMEVFCI